MLSALRFTDDSGGGPWESTLSRFRQFILRGSRYQALSLISSTSADTPAATIYAHHGRSNGLGSLKPESGGGGVVRQLIVLEDLPYLGRPELVEEFNSILLHALSISKYSSV